MLSEPRTQMRGRSELLAAMFAYTAVRLGELGTDGVWLVCSAEWSLGSC